MLKHIKSITKAAINNFGYDVRIFNLASFPPEFSSRDIEIFNFIRNNNLSMVSRERLIATISACKYAVANNIEGDFVECGVWRGGNSIAAKMIFEEYKSDKKVFLFDTFGGMTEPTIEDVRANGDKKAFTEFENNKKDSHNEWCYASIEDVQQNFAKSGVDVSNVHFIKGDVCQTLLDKTVVPGKISVLRLDTDWYESTRMEMNILYPLMSKQGVLLIDDYGHWDGARKAIEEYFQSSGVTRPMLHYTDHSGRAAIVG